MLPEVRMARIIDAIGLHQARKLSCVEAAELLGMSERHFRRLRDAYEAHGAEGIVDRRRGRASGRRALAEVEPAVRRVQQKLLAPLSAQEGAKMVTLLVRLITGHNGDLTGAPSTANEAGPEDDAA